MSNNHLKRIDFIRNLGVFHDFRWDKETPDFQGINILYGRNYSGKTTLSRIFRALETRHLPQNYSNPSFQLTFERGQSINQTTLDASPYTIRVFNSDFEHDNLRFVIDPESSVKSFAVLGEENVKLNEEIKRIEDILGVMEEGKETGLYAKKRDAKRNWEEAQKNAATEEKDLEDSLTDKARNIKNDTRRFDSVTYNKTHLLQDITKVQGDEYELLSPESKANFEEKVQQDKLTEKAKVYPAVSLNFAELLERVARSVNKGVGDAKRILEFVKGDAPDKWIREGMEHHGADDVCSFCANHVSAERWQDLENYFDETVQKLEQELDELITDINREKENVEAIKMDGPEKFYPGYRNKFEKIFDKVQASIRDYCVALDVLNQEIEKRKGNIMTPHTFTSPANHSNALQSALNEYSELANESSDHDESVEEEQKTALEKIRFHEVHNFILSINYQAKKENIERLKQNEKDKKESFEELCNSIENEESNLLSTRAKLGNEQSGAQLVNDYLRSWDSGRLSLVAKEDEDGIEPTQGVKFEIQRDGKKAFNLSEGESRLLAFCYFLAKLKDVDTSGSKPIIWIDDPVSSLDGNHIFLVYSLLKSTIVSANNYRQLFVSTHNLEFLKYLTQIKHNKHKDTCYYQVAREGNESKISPMPKYLREYATEFNYLFHQIYQCAHVENINDENFHVVRGFGNNARKFLELYLYYKYPDYSNFSNKLEKFFGEEEVSRIASQKLGNEASHACSLEKANAPSEWQEAKDIAKQILNRLEELDKDQYRAFVNSTTTV